MRKEWSCFAPVTEDKTLISSRNRKTPKNPKIKAELEQKKQNDKAFAENGAAQLDWVYRQTPYYEKAHLQYPVYRVN